MSEIEKSKRFGVPTFETCQKIQFPKTTVLGWYKNYYGRMDVLSDRHADLLNDKHGKGYVTFVCDAPQIHEILGVLPKTITVDGQDLFLDFQTIDIDYQYVQYSKENLTQSDFFVRVVDNNYADAFAKLYQQIQILNSVC